MAKSPEQKLKLLYLMQIFLEHTDEDHAIQMKEIIQYLKLNGVSAERKSIYSDIESLNQFGFDIIGYQEKGSYYYKLVHRKFELPELKLLVDTVQASKLIPENKSHELIKKIESLASKYQARELQRQVYVKGRVKTLNASVYYIVDGLHTAINENRNITFRYCEWTVDKTMTYRKNGERYQVSPWALVWDSENYYLVGFALKEQKIKHYRVDKIASLELTKEPRSGKEYFDHTNLAGYTKQVFGMFGGAAEPVKLEVSRQMVGVIIDRFGQDVKIIPKDENTIYVYVDVAVSPQFFGWIVALGDGVKLIAPEKVVNQMRKEIQRLQNQYAEK